MGGRVDDIAVVESNPSIIYVGFATGGIWKIDQQRHDLDADLRQVSGVVDRRHRDRAVEPDIIYVGTGEANNRQSSSFGGGVYKSTDGGKTFEYVGLKDTQSIAPHRRPSEGSEHRLRRRARAPVRTESGARPVTRRPTAARPGRTPSSSTTTPASPTWRWIPSNPNILFAASYQRRRTPWGFNGGGAGSGLWKTTDGGEDLDQADRQRPAGQPDDRPHRPRHRTLEAVHDLRVLRGRARAAAPAPASTTTAR